MRGEAWGMIYRNSVLFLQRFSKILSKQTKILNGPNLVPHTYGKEISEISAPEIFKTKTCVCSFLKN